MKIQQILPRILYLNLQRTDHNKILFISTNSETPITIKAEFFFFQVDNNPCNPLIQKIMEEKGWKLWNTDKLAIEGLNMKFSWGEGVFEKILHGNWITLRFKRDIFRSLENDIYITDRNSAMGCLWSLQTVKILQSKGEREWKIGTWNLEGKMRGEISKEIGRVILLSEILVLFFFFFPPRKFSPEVRK